MVEKCIACVRLTARTGGDKNGGKPWAKGKAEIARTIDTEIVRLIRIKSHLGSC